MELRKAANKGKIGPADKILFRGLYYDYAEEFFTRWQEYYDKDKLFNLKGYTDSFVFDAVRLEMEAEGKIKNNDLNDGRWSG